MDTGEPPAVVSGVLTGANGAPTVVKGALTGTRASAKGRGRMVTMVRPCVAAPFSRSLPASLALMGAAASALAQPCGGMRSLGSLGGRDGAATDSSADGNVVVGRISEVSGLVRAFRWTPAGGLALLPGLGGNDSRAEAVSADGGDIFGRASNASNRGRGALWDLELGLIDLGMPDTSHPMDVTRVPPTNQGHVVAGVTSAFGQPRAFRWTAEGGLVNLGTLFAASYGEGVSNDGQTVVGWYIASSGRRNAFRWTAAAGMQNLGTLGGAESKAMAASGDGSVIVGNSLAADGIARAFRWTAAGGMQSLGTLGGVASGAEDITPDGSVVVGWSTNSAGTLRAFRWTAAGGMVDLGNSAGRTWAEALGVSADGNTVVGREGDASGVAGPFRWGPDLWIAGAPGSETVCVTGGATFGVTAGGSGPFTYRWEWAHPVKRPDWTPVLTGTNAAADGTPVFEAGGGASSMIVVLPPGGQGAYPAFLVADPPEIRLGFRCLISTACGSVTTPYVTLSLCTADANCDGFMDFFDYDHYVDAFETGGVEADFNRDGFVDFFDYDDFVAAFEAGC